MMRRTILALLVGLFCGSGAQADLLVFKPTGLAGDGLLGGNVVPNTPVNPGSGGMGATLITIDTLTQTLHIDISWGSGNGYTDMSGPVTNLHLHGPTPSGAPDSFNEVTTNIIINLGNSPNFDPDPTEGGLFADFFLSNQEIQWMREGRFYINVHTALNDTGEIRGYLILVPEPGSFFMLVAGTGVFLVHRRRDRRVV